MFGLKSWDWPRFKEPCVNTEETPTNVFILENQNPVKKLFVDYVLEQMISLQENNNNNKN